MSENDQAIHRRSFLAAGAAGLALTAFGGVRQARAELSDTEQANLDLVNAMCRDIEELDMTAMTDYFSENIEFQLFDGQPLIKGREPFLAMGAQFMGVYERAEFIIHRSHVLGKLVINERTDNFYAKEGGQNQSFHVTGFFVVRDGKIHEWKDYLLPGTPVPGQAAGEPESESNGASE